MHIEKKEKPVGREAQVKYLREHFRYSTMNSWNGQSSYAARVKISQLPGLSLKERDACYALLEVEDSLRESGFIHTLSDFDRKHHGRWQIGQNGLSGGYLVLYQGGEKPDEHKSRCPKCGNRMFSEAEEAPCGRCGAKCQPYSAMQMYTTGVGTDSGEDFEDWIDEDINDRVDLVWEFDAVCLEACRVFVDYAMSVDVVEEEVMIPRKVKVAQPREDV